MRYKRDITVYYSICNFAPSTPSLHQVLEVPRFRRDKFCQLYAEKDQGFACGASEVSNYCQLYILKRLEVSPAALQKYQITVSYIY